jgi:cell division protein ZipA
MDALRWILLGLGAFVLLVVYLLSRPTRPKQRADLLDEASELDRSTDVELRSDAGSDEISLDGLREQLRGLKAVMQEEPAEPEHGATLVPPEESTPKAKPSTVPGAGSPKRAPELLIILHIAARAPRRFVGPELQHALEAEDLRFGDMDIYHRLVEVDGEQQMLFSVTNAVKPGTLTPEELPELETPGLSLFMRLPGPVPGPNALERLLEAAEGLAGRLDGELQDESRSALSAQMREHLRERVREWAVKYERKQ